MGSRTGGEKRNTTRQPSGISKLKANENLDTKTLYTKEGKYTTEREKVHDRIVNKLLRESGKTQQPKMTIILASDDRTILPTVRSERDYYSKVTELSPMRIITSLPEYKKLIDRGFTRAEATKKLSREAKDVYNKASQKLAKEKRNFILTNAFRNSETAKQIIKHFKDNGYEVRLTFSYIPSANGSPRQQRSAVLEKLFEDIKHHATSYTYNKIVNNSVHKIESRSYSKKSSYSRSGKKTIKRYNGVTKSKPIIKKTKTVKTINKVKPTTTVKPTRTVKNTNRKINKSFVKDSKLEKMNDIKNRKKKEADAFMEALYKFAEEYNK